LQWDVTKSFYIGVEAIYQHLNTATTSTGLTGAVIPPAADGCPAGGCTVADQSNWTFTLRTHKDFLP
jgi:hypothetical protein